MGWWSQIRDDVEQADGAVVGSIVGGVIAGAASPVGQILGGIAGDNAVKSLQDGTSSLAPPATPAVLTPPATPNPDSDPATQQATTKAAKDEDLRTAGGVASTMLHAYAGQSAPRVARTLLSGY